MSEPITLMPEVMRLLVAATDALTDLTEYVHLPTEGEIVFSTNDAPKNIALVCYGETWMVELRTPEATATVATIRERTAHYGGGAR